MARTAVMVSFFMLTVACSLKFASAILVEMTAEGFDVGRPIETACFEDDISFQTTTQGLYVGVPSWLFNRNGKNGKNACGDKLKVSCVGGKDVCKSGETLELTVIDTLDGEFVEISNKAFNIISDFDIGVIEVKVTTEF